MQTRLFGSMKRPVPVIGQGTWYSNRDDRKSAVAALRVGLDLGLTHIDTAEMYLSGEAEEWVAEAIASRRDEVFLVSKVLPQNASRAGTVAACEASLARLKTDRLDCYLLHWRTGRHPLAETIDAFQRLEHERKILAWGVSNFDVHDLKEAQRLGNGRGPVCDQVLYHIEERAVEHEVIPWCEEHGAAMVSYSPFAHGAFPKAGSTGGGLLKTIADELGCTPRQVALGFLLRRQASFVIPKAASRDHVAENAGAGDVELTEGQIARLDRAFPLGALPRELPML